MWVECQCIYNFPCFQSICVVVVCVRLVAGRDAAGYIAGFVAVAFVVGVVGMRISNHLDWNRLSRLVCDYICNIRVFYYLFWMLFCLLYLRVFLDGVQMVGFVLNAGLISNNLRINNKFDLIPMQLENCST